MKATRDVSLEKQSSKTGAITCIFRYLMYIKEEFTWNMSVNYRRTYFKFTFKKILSVT